MNTQNENNFTYSLVPPSRTSGGTTDVQRSALNPSDKLCSYASSRHELIQPSGGQSKPEQPEQDPENQQLIVGVISCQISKIKITFSSATGCMQYSQCRWDGAPYYIKLASEFDTRWRHSDEECSLGCNGRYRLRAGDG